MIDSFEFTGRERKPLSKKLNPIWWLLNDDEQKLDDGTTDWYMAGKPQWLRRVCWELRNPLQNLRAFVLGVQDRNYVVYGRAPVLTVQRDDLFPLDGTLVQWCVCLIGGWLPLPFISFAGKHVVVYFGWQPSGFFGAKLNVRL